MTSLQGGYDRYQRVDVFFAVEDDDDDGEDGEDDFAVKENYR